LTTPWVIPILLGTRAAVNVLTAPQWGRMLLRTIADLILIMERAHWYADEGKIDSDDIRSACNYYQEGDRQANVHKDIDGLLPTFSINDTFNTTKLAAGLKVIVQKHRFQQSKLKRMMLSQREQDINHVSSQRRIDVSGSGKPAT
jgi:hypothetical protein